MLGAVVKIYNWNGRRRHELERFRARLMRELAYRAYHLAGELGEWAREVFARTAWVEAGGVEEWHFPLPVAAEEAPSEICGACGQPLPDGDST